MSSAIAELVTGELVVEKQAMSVAFSATDAPVTTEQVATVEKDVVGEQEASMISTIDYK
jgi:hypothetical protein